MTATTWSALQQLLIDRYDELRRRLALRLHSEELARETLHETWLLLDRSDEPSSIKSPAGYLLRMALNVAIDGKRRADRRAPAAQISALLEVPAEAPDPVEEVIARQDLDALERAIEELTPRRRRILLASRIEGMPLHRIASELGVSQRLVEMELRHALEHCADRLDRKVVQIFGPRPTKSSRSEATKSHR